MDVQCSLFIVHFSLLILSRAVFPVLVHLKTDAVSQTSVSLPVRFCDR